MNINQSSEIAVIINSMNHRGKWKNKKPSLEHAVELIAEECHKLQMAVEGSHPDSPALELIQIGGLCINALRFFYTEQEIRDQLTIETKRHFPELFPDEEVCSLKRNP
jgi:hypothetical protein